MNSCEYCGEAACLKAHTPDEERIAKRAATLLMGAEYDAGCLRGDLEAVTRECKMLRAALRLAMTKDMPWEDREVAAVADAALAGGESCT